MKKLKIISLFIFSISFIVLSFSLQAQTLQAGASSKNITPNPLIPVSGGVGIPNPATIKHGELTTRALVLVKNETKIAIVAIDNIGVPKLIGDRIRALVPDIKPENILIGVTHTHSAPDVYGFADEKGNSGADLKYIDLLVNQSAEAINDAYKILDEESNETRQKFILVMSDGIPTHNCEAASGCEGTKTGLPSPCKFGVGDQYQRRGRADEPVG